MWTSIPGAATYDLYLSTSEGPLQIRGLTETEWVPTEDLPQGFLQWWVLSYDENGNRGIWTDAIDADINRPLLDVVSDHRGFVEFSWSQLSGATSTTLVLQRDDGETWQQSVEAFSLTLDMLPTGDFTAWVKSDFADGSGSLWSRPAKFSQTLGGRTEPLLPGELTQNARPRFRWWPQQDAVAFEVVATNGERTLTATVSGSQWYPPTELEPGDWNWHVRPIFADGSYGAFSRVGRFVVNLRITELIGNTGDPDFGIAWTPFPGSSEYEVYVRYADGSVMTFRTTTNEFRYADQPAMEDGVWSFWVRPLDTYAGTWSAMRPLVVQSPGSLTSSPKLAYEATADPYPVFDWETADGASAYEIEIRTYVSSHIGDRYSRVRVTDSSWKSEERFAFTEHTWRVRVFDQDGDPGSWSAPAVIVVHPYSVLKAPLGSTTSTTPQFVWTEDSRATHYFLYVEDENGNEVLFEKELTGTTYTHDVPFAPGTYRAWVKTIRSADIERSWSPPLDFQIV